MRTRIKVCGMTRPEDVQHAVACGVDAIGLILHANSPRLISKDAASQIRKQVPAFVNVVGVFVDAPRSFILDCVDQIGLDLIQLHGDETPDFAESLSQPYIKAIRAKSPEQVVKASGDFSSARALLLDPFVEGQHGGTGQLLSDSVWPAQTLESPLILAGGLGPDNIRQRLNKLSPFAVDINSGVEMAPGKKDWDKLRECVKAIQKFDQDKFLKIDGSNSGGSNTNNSNTNNSNANR